MRGFILILRRSFKRGQLQDSGMNLHTKFVHKCQNRKTDISRHHKDACSIRRGRRLSLCMMFPIRSVR